MTRPQVYLVTFDQPLDAETRAVWDALCRLPYGPGGYWRRGQALCVEREHAGLLAGLGLVCEGQGVLC